MFNPTKGKKLTMAAAYQYSEYIHILYPMSLLLNIET
jgi:hypothetical protein